MHHFVYIVQTENQPYKVGVTMNLRHEMVRLKRQNAPASNTTKLLYYEHYSQHPDATSRNFELLSKSQEHLQKLVKSANPFGEDLSEMFS